MCELGRSRLGEDAACELLLCQRFLAGAARLLFAARFAAGVLRRFGDHRGDALDQLAATGGVAEKEMLRTFNCGIGMIAVVPADWASKVADVLTAEGETVVTLGQMIARADGAPGVSYKGKLGL